MPSPGLHTSWRHFQRHPWQLVLVLLGILVGVAVVTAVDLVNQSARESFRLANEQLLGGVSHQIKADGPIPEDLYRQLRVELGVLRATPVVSEFVKDDLGKGILLRVIGIDPLAGDRLNQGLDGTRLNPPLGLRDLTAGQYGAVLDTHTARRLGKSVNDIFPIRTRNGRASIQIRSLLEGSDDPRSNNLLIMDIGQAQELLGLRGSLSHINLSDLNPAELTRVQAWLTPPYRLESAHDQQQSTAGLTDSFHLNLSALSLLALVVGLFLVYNSSHFSLIQRQPVFAQLRALGLTAEELRRDILWEVLGIAAVGSLLGIVAGIGLAHLLFGLVVQTIDDLYLSNNINRLFIPAPILFKSVLIGTGGCLLASWQSIRQMAQIPPRQSQLRYQQERSAARNNLQQLYLALALLGAAGVLAIWRGGGLFGGFVAITCLLLGLALMTPMLVSGATKLLSAPSIQRQQNKLPLWRMAVRDSNRSLSRTGVAVMALMIAVAATIGMSVMIDSFRNSLESWLQQRLNADVYLRVHQEVPGNAAPLPKSLIAFTQKHPAVAAVSTFKGVASSVNGRRIEVFSTNLPPPMKSGYRFTDADPGAVWDRFEKNNQILISEPLANRWQLKTGDNISLETGSGPHQFSVAGIYYDFGSDNGRVLIPEARFKIYWQDARPTGMGVYLRNPNQADTLISEIQQNFGQNHSLDISHTARLLEISIEVFERTFLITDVLRLLAIGVAFVGILGALMALQLERQAELHILRSIGLTPAERARLLLYQSGLLGFLAGIIAIPTGHLLAWLLIEVIHLRAFGWSMAYQPSFSAAALGLLLSVCAALLASIWPAWRFAHLRPRLQTE